MDVFPCVRNLLANPNLDEDAKARVKKVVVTSIPELIKIDGSETAALVLQEFSEEHENVLEKLAPFPELQYQVTFPFLFLVPLLTNSTQQLLLLFST